jgi:hypothetical protein
MVNGYHRWGIVVAVDVVEEGVLFFVDIDVKLFNSI